MQNLFRSVLIAVALTSTLAANIALANVGAGIEVVADPMSRLQQCVQTCQAYSAPGWELNQCIATRCKVNSAQQGSDRQALTSTALMEDEVLALRCQYAPELCQ